MNTHNLCFEQIYEKFRSFYLKIFSFLEVKFSVYLNRHVFVMMEKKLLPVRKGGKYFHVSCFLWTYKVALAG